MQENSENCAQELSSAADSDEQMIFKSILDNMPSIVWLKDVNGNFKMANNAFARICNLPLDKIIGKTGTEVWPGELGATYTAYDAEIISSGKGISIEEEIITSDGLKWFEVDKLPILDKNGKITGILGVAKDISERKIIEMELLRSQIQTINVNKREILIRNIFEKIRSSLDIDETLTYICDEAAKLFNVQRATIIQFLTPENFENYNVRREYKVNLDVKGVHSSEFITKAAAYWGRKLSIEGKILAFDNIQKSDTPEYFRECYNSLGVKSMIGYPIKMGDKQWGSLVLSEYNNFRNWSDDDKDLLKTISEQIYISINQAELFSTTKKQAERETLVRKITAAIGSTLNIDEIKLKIVNELGIIFQADRCFIRTYENAFHCDTEYLSSPEIKSIKNYVFDDNFIMILRLYYLKYGYLLTEDVDKIDEPDLFAEFKELNNSKDISSIKKMAKDLDLKSSYAFPVIIDNKLAGSFILQYTRERHSLNKDEINLLVTLAGHAGIAIQNGQLFSTIEKNERYTRRVLNNIKDGIITVNHNCIIESCNPAIKEIFGYSSDETIGKTIGLLLPHTCTKDAKCGFILNKCHFKKYFKTAKEAVGVKSDGCKFPIEIETSEITFGKNNVILMVIRDITQRKEVDKIKNEFISTVSHELRTPLTSIKGALGLISSGVMGALSPEIKELIDIASNNSTRLIQLINDILDLEKIEAGKMDFNFEILELGPVIDLSIEANRSFADQYNVTIELENSLPEIKINVDKNRLIQVMTNLLSNSSKFSPSGSTVTISTSLVNKGVRIAVKDQGTGIPKEFQDRIFQKFMQVDSSDSRGKGGTGLGLSICKVIVEKLGGSIDYMTEKNEGTTFYVDLPVYNLQNNLQTGFLSDQQRILICEDDKDIASLISLLLKQNGYYPEIAYNVEQAKELLSKAHYDLITLDIILPGEDGLSLISELRATGDEIPIIVISIKADEYAQNKDYKVNEWVNKPIDHKKLLLAIKQAIPPKGKPRILHVEDDTDVQTILSSLLSNIAEISTAVDVAAANKLLNEEAFDLVILDINLSNGDNGLDLLSLIKNDITKSLPVLIFSVHDVDENILKLADAVLVKSKTSNEEIIDTIKKLTKVAI